MKNVTALISLDKYTGENAETGENGHDPLYCNQIGGTGWLPSDSLVISSSTVEVFDLEKDGKYLLMLTPGEKYWSKKYNEWRQGYNRNFVPVSGLDFAMLSVSKEFELRGSKPLSDKQKAKQAERKAEQEALATAASQTTAPKEKK